LIPGNPKSDSLIFILKNETFYPFILSLELYDGWNDKDISFYLETNNQVKYAEVNIDKTFGWGNARLDSVMLFNLKDTTSIVWNATLPGGSYTISYFESLFTHAPPWEISSEDSLKWHISSSLWSGYTDEKWDVRKTLRVTDELLDIMEKDYSMLERFPEFYEK
jgi:hypothetical protein